METREQIRHHPSTLLHPNGQLIRFSAQRPHLWGRLAFASGDAFSNSWISKSWEMHGICIAAVFSR